MNGEPSKSYDFGDELDSMSADDWTPRKEANDTAPKPDLEQVAEVAEKAGFTSREPKPVKQKEPDDQITIRSKKIVIDGFRAFASSQEPKWPLGYTLERALASLKKELEG